MNIISDAQTWWMVRYDMRAMLHWLDLRSYDRTGCEHKKHTHTHTGMEEFVQREVFDSKCWILHLQGSQLHW